MAAQRFDRWQPEQFLDTVLQKAMYQRLGTFQDEWNPLMHLGTHGFHELCAEHVESVMAFEEKENGDAKLLVASTNAETGGAARAETPLTIPDGIAALAQLRRTIQNDYTVLGNWHWGDSTDVLHLSEALEIGVLIFCEHLQNRGQHCLYSVGSEREDFPFWMAIWWDEPTHFRLAELAPLDSNGAGTEPAYTCFWSAKDLPESLLQEYRYFNRRTN